MPASDELNLSCFYVRIAGQQLPQYSMREHEALTIPLKRKAGRTRSFLFGKLRCEGFLNSGIAGQFATPDMHRREIEMGKRKGCTDGIGRTRHHLPTLTVTACVTLMTVPPVSGASEDAA